MSSTIELQEVSSGYPVATDITVAQRSATATLSAQDRPSNHNNTVINTSQRAEKVVWRYLIEYLSKLQKLCNTIHWRDAVQYTEAVENFRAFPSKCWTKLATSLTHLGIKYELSTWLGVALTLVVGSASLRYAYVAMKIAEWTAAKDFYELCQSLNVCWLLENPPRLDFMLMTFLGLYSCSDF